MVERRDTKISTMSTNTLRVMTWVLCVGWTFAAQTKLSDSEAPLWTEEIQQDLSHYGGVSFLNNEKLLAYEVDSSGQLSSRESPQIASAFRLHISLLDARSGRLILSRDWGTRLHNTEVQVTTGGVLVKTGSGGIMKMYSPDFTQARDLPLAQDTNGAYYTSVSASGQTVAISHYLTRVVVH